MSISIPGPNDRVEAVEIAGAVREKIAAAAQRVVRVLKEETSGPKEALIVLHFVTEYLKEKTGIKAVEAIVVDTEN